MNNRSNRREFIKAAGGIAFGFGAACCIGGAGVAIIAAHEARKAGLDEKLVPADEPVSPIPTPASAIVTEVLTAVEGEHYSISPGDGAVINGTNTNESPISREELLKHIAAGGMICITDMTDDPRMSVDAICFECDLTSLEPQITATYNPNYYPNQNYTDAIKNHVYPDPQTSVLVMNKDGVVVQLLSNQTWVKPPELESSTLPVTTHNYNPESVEGYLASYINTDQMIGYVIVTKPE